MFYFKLANMQDLDARLEAEMAHQLINGAWAPGVSFTQIDEYVDAMFNEAFSRCPFNRPYIDDETSEGRLYLDYAWEDSVAFFDPHGDIYYLAGLAWVKVEG